MLTAHPLAVPAPPPASCPLSIPLMWLDLAPCGTRASGPREPEAGQEHSQLSQLHIRTTNKHCCLATPPRPSIPGQNHGTGAVRHSLATITRPTLSFLRQED